jgi:hypothetical protein
MDRKKAVAIRTRAEELIRQIEAEFEVKLGKSKVVYGATSLQLKLELSEQDGSGLTLNRETERLRAMALTYGFDGDPVGKVFTLRGEEWTLVGAINGTKYSFLAKRGTDLSKTYKLPEMAVRRACGCKLGEWEKDRVV